MENPSWTKDSAQRTGEKNPEAEKRKEIVMQMMRSALREIERKYGTGKGDGENPKNYHNLVHTKDITLAASKIADEAFKNGKVSQRDRPLILLAACFHDIEQSFGSGANEKESARIAEEKMKEAGIFSPEDIIKVRNMILATTVYFEQGILKQSVTEDILTKIIADADLARLGMETKIYWARALDFLKETKQGADFSEKDLLEFTKNQITFLSNFEFHTEEAKKLFNNKNDNIEYTKQLFAALNTPK